jgi:transposase
MPATRLDNLSTHKIQIVRRLLSARGVDLRFLPPYSPDPNPIELAFAKLKAHLRQRAARTLDELYSALAASLNSFSPTHCRAFFRHARYASI